MKRGLALFLSSYIGLTALVGCGSLYPKKGIEINNQQYKQMIYNKAEKLAQDTKRPGKVSRLEEAITLFLRIREIKQAEKCAGQLLEIDSERGIIAFENLQHYKNTQE